MARHAHDVRFVSCAISAVVFELAGLILGGKTHQLTVTASDAKIAGALATPVGTATWIGAYLEIASFGLFLAFAVWAIAKLGEGVLAQLGRAAAVGYATLSIASLAVIDALSYRAGHGISVPIGRTLVAVNEALYVASWFLVALFLLAVGLIALKAARRALGWSSVAIAVYTLVAAPSINTFGQFTIPLFLLWTAGAAITLARRGRIRLDTNPIPQRS